MCLAVPAKLVETYSDRGIHMGKVDFGGVFKAVCLEHVPTASPGDFVLVHVGFALARIDAEEAARMLAVLEELGELSEGVEEIET